MMKKWYRSRRNQILICLVVVATCVVFNFTLNPGYIERDLDLTRSHLSLAGNTAQNSSASSKTEQNGSAASKTAQNGIAASKTSQNSSVGSRNDSSDTVINYVDPNDKRSSIIRSIEVRLEESLKEDKGTGCEIPRLDPFAKEVTQFDKNVTLVCAGRDWVKCYLHECKVVEEIHADIGNIECNYQDIIYMSDAKYVIGSSKRVQGREPYVLERSDHVRIMCTGKRKDNSQHIKWKGYGIGFRASSARVPAGGGGPVDVLIFGFDSTSKDAFIRKMPKSYKYLTEELRATVLNSYNIVGDGTPAALFPILTGKTELELPDLRRSMSKETLDGFPFIFYKLKQMGFHTAYFEDMPSIGTFQYRFNGFKRQPADHYLRAVFLDEGGAPSWYSSKPGAYCMGDTPRHRLMMNITEQFLQLPGSHFGFTFVADITHDDFNMLSTADGATERFLRALHHGGHLDRTLLFVMGDHGPRFANVRDTLQGKLEERLPLMAVRVPPALTRTRPDVLGALAGNAGVLTTPHDVHATILDALGLRHLANPYRVRGADLPRALSLLHPIPRSRSCSEAGIEPHWCACLTWQPLPAAAPLRARAAAALLDFLNSLTEPRRDVCMPRTLTEISWVMVQRANSRLLAFKGAKDNDGYTGHFDGKTTRTRDNYQIKMTVGPGHGVYEASATYLINEDKFLFDVRDVSRVSAYNSEPSCISESQPHLNKYCYCREHLATAAS